MSHLPLTDLPVGYLLEQMVFPDRQRMIGKRFRIVHLTSERGRSLNGKWCTVRNFDRTVEARCRCVMEDSNESMKLKAVNLMPEQDDQHVLHAFMKNSPPMDDNVLKEALHAAIQKHRGSTDRQDLTHRLGLYRTLYEKLVRAGEEGAKLEDSDYCFPCGAGSELLDGNFGVVMNSMKLPCRGDNVMDMRYVDRGLKGDDTASCSICNDVITSNTDQIIVTLPCVHAFHDDCISRWLGSRLGSQNWNCPECREIVPDDMSTFRIHYLEQLQRRVAEFPLSGFCTKCMMWYMERNRNEELPLDVDPSSFS